LGEERGQKKGALGDALETLVGEEKWGRPRQILSDHDRRPFKKGRSGWGEGLWKRTARSIRDHRFSKWKGFILRCGRKDTTDDRPKRTAEMRTEG